MDIQEPLPRSVPSALVRPVPCVRLTGRLADQAERSARQPGPGRSVPGCGRTPTVRRRAGRSVALSEGGGRAGPVGRDARARAGPGPPTPSKNKSQSPTPAPPTPDPGPANNKARPRPRQSPADKMIPREEVSVVRYLVPQGDWQRAALTARGAEATT
jgi:hypothetical protein